MNLPRRLEIVAAISMVVATFLPFASLGVSMPGVPALSDMQGLSFSTSIRLWDLVSGTSDWQGQLAAALVIVGGAAALCCTVYRLLQPWPSRASAGLSALGFGAFAAGTILMFEALAAGNNSAFPFSTADLLGQVGMAITPAIGLVADVAVGVAGAAICAVSLFDRTPARAGQAAFAAGSAAWPWGGPGAGSYPAAYAPPAYPYPPYQAQPYAAQPYGYPSYPAPGMYTPPAPSMYTPPAPPAVQPVVSGAVPQAASALLTVSEGGRISSFQVALGQPMSIGRDPDMSVRPDDPLVAPRHLTVTPTGAGWTIRSQDPLGTCQVIDQAGRLVGLRDEMTIATGQLIVGTTLILLSPIPQA